MNLPMPKISSPPDWDTSLLVRVNVTKIRKVEIIHTPVKDVLLENNAIRANSLLNALLSTLAAREAIVESCKTERI